MIIESIYTKKLTNDKIDEICNLKNSHWNFGINSQKSFFIKNYKSNDLHNLIIYRNKIVGYNSLRNIDLIVPKKKSKFLLFDTLIISKKFRGKNLSKLLMLYNNIIINDKNKGAFLFCEKNLIEFYSKFGWKKLIKKKFKIKNINIDKVLMGYNLETFNL